MMIRYYISIKVGFNSRGGYKCSVVFSLLYFGSKINKFGTICHVLVNKSIGRPRPVRRIHSRKAFLHNFSKKSHVVF